MGSPSLTRVRGLLQFVAVCDGRFVTVIRTVKLFTVAGGSRKQPKNVITFYCADHGFGRGHDADGG